MPNFDVQIDSVRRAIGENLRETMRQEIERTGEEIRRSGIFQTPTQFVFGSPERENTSTMPAASETPKKRKPSLPRKHLTFGIEIECQIPHSYYEGLRYQIDRNKWDFGTDGSVRQLNGHRTAEIRSKIFHAPTDLETVHNFVSELQHGGVKADDSCGGHVHVGLQKFFGHMTAGEQFAVIGRIIDGMTKLENAIFYYSGGDVRKRGQYAKPLTDRLDQPFNLFSDRYFALNLQSLLNRGTIEFRIFVGSTDPDQWVANIKVATGICMAALENKPIPDITADDNGLRAMEQFFGIASGTLKAFIDPALLKFRKDISALRNPKFTFSMDAMRVWKYYIHNRGKRRDDNYRQFYLALRKLLNNAQSVMIIETPRNEQLGRNGMLVAYIARDGQSQADVVRLNGSEFEILSNDREYRQGYYTSTSQ